jgi:hypothetical protein
VRRSLALLVLLGLAAAVFGGCGGDGDPSPQRAAAPSAESVVRGWADDLRRGDVEAATDRFAVPALVANGTPLIRLETRLQVVHFNATLPCGGVVTATERRGKTIVATFRLTDRPGAKCDGAGNPARAAFQVRGGKIVRWVRMDLGAPRGPVV